MDKAALVARCSQHQLPANGTKGVMMQALRHHWEARAQIMPALVMMQLPAPMPPQTTLRRPMVPWGGNGSGSSQSRAAAEWLAACTEDCSSSSWSSWGTPLAAETASNNVTTDSDGALEVAQDILSKARLEADEVCRKVGVSPRRTVATQTARTHPPA